MSAAQFWIIGCGAMAGAMLSRWLATGLDPASVTVVDPALPKLENVRVLPAIPESVPPAARLLIGIKPQQLAQAAPDIRRLVGPGTELISMLAGTPVATLARHFPGARIVRIMPNLPVSLGKGVVAAHPPQCRSPELDALLSPLGLIEWIDEEDEFHIVTALSGCGPAFLYRFIDALAEGAGGLGLDPGQAARLALATVDGAAALAAAAEASPTELADRVASKGGVTRAGLDVLDGKPGLEQLMQAALRAAAERSAALAKAD